MMHLSKESYYAPLSVDSIYKPYEIKNIVDRVGGGDAFAVLGAYICLNHRRITASSNSFKLCCCCIVFKTFD